MPDTARTETAATSAYLNQPRRSLAEVLRDRDTVIVARDLCDMAFTAGEIAVTLHHVGKALGETYAEGLPEQPVVRAAIDDLRQARSRIADLIAELEAEAA